MEEAPENARNCCILHMHMERMNKYKCMLRTADTQIQLTLKNLLYLLNYEGTGNIPAHTIKAYDGSGG
jgi:hypothetical protein